MASSALSRSQRRRAVAARRGTARRVCASCAHAEHARRRTAAGCTARQRARMRSASAPGSPSSRGQRFDARRRARRRRPRAAARRLQAGWSCGTQRSSVGSSADARPVQRASPRARDRSAAACDRRRARARARPRACDARRGSRRRSAFASAARQRVAHRDSRVRSRPCGSLAPAVAVALGQRHRARSGPRCRRDRASARCRARRQPSRMASTHCHAASVSSRRTNSVPLPSMRIEVQALVGEAARALRELLVQVQVQRDLRQAQAAAVQARASCSSAAARCVPPAAGGSAGVGLRSSRAAVAKIECGTARNCR